MTNKTKALRDLLSAVEYGRVGQFQNLDSQFGHGNGIIAKRAYNGSLDAAMTLHEAVLPDLPWDIWRGTDMNGKRYYGCNIATVDTAYHEAPARAWMICILRAMIEQAMP